MEKNWLCLSHLREKSKSIHMIQMKNLLMKLWIWDTEIVFICSQVNIHYKRPKKLVDFDIFFRDPRRPFSPLRNFLLDWRKIETTCDRKFMKEKLKVRQNNLALFKRKFGVAHEEESENELKN